MFVYFYQALDTVKSELRRLHVQEQAQKEHELDAAKQRQKAINDLERGVIYYIYLTHLEFKPYVDCMKMCRIIQWTS